MFAEVTIEDQQMINTFGRLNDRQKVTKEQIKVLKAQLENLDDAADEMMMTDDETVDVFVGGAFYALSIAEAEQRLEKDKEELSKRQSELEALQSQIDGELAELKVRLKSKFGVSRVVLENEICLFNCCHLKRMRSIWKNRKRLFSVLSIVRLCSCIRLIHIFCL